MVLFNRCIANGLILFASCVQLIVCAVTATTTPSSTTTSSSSSSLTSSTPSTTNLTDPCRLNVDPGPCFGKFLKFYFNSDEQKCKAFYFGGCYGNANQFQTVEECEFTCVENDWPPYPINNGGNDGNDGDGDDGDDGSKGNETEPAEEIFSRVGVLLFNPKNHSTVEELDFENGEDLGVWRMSNLLIVEVVEDQGEEEGEEEITTEINQTDGVQLFRADNSSSSTTTTATTTTEKSVNATTTKSDNATTASSTTTARASNESTTTTGDENSESSTTTTVSSTTVVPSIVHAIKANQNDQNGTLERNVTFSRKNSTVLEFRLKITDYHYYKDSPGLMQKNPWLYVELISLPLCEDEEAIQSVTWYEEDDAKIRHDDESGVENCTLEANFVEERLEIFDLDNYGFQYNGMEEWTDIRFEFGRRVLKRSSYTLRFTMRSGIGNIFIDDITITSTAQMKNNTELYEEWMKTSTTITTTVTTTTTTSNSTDGGNSSTTVQPTTTDNNGNSNTTNSPYTGSTDGNASQIVLIVLLVVVSVALVGLSVKHWQTQNKLREYRVNRGTPQNFDNPLFTGQHTSADRYGSIQH